VVYTRTVFTPDGKYVLVDSDFSILKVEGAKLADTGKHFKGAGPPSLGSHEPGAHHQLPWPGSTQPSISCRNRQINSRQPKPVCVFR
jgi:hypothetical protein